MSLSLGLAKDSIGDLTKLAEDGDNFEDEDQLHTHVGDISEVLVKGTVGFENLDREISKQDISGSFSQPPGNKARTACDDESAGSLNSFDISSEVFEPLSVRSKDQEKKKTKKPWCCFLQPWLGSVKEEDDCENRVPHLVTDEEEIRYQYPSCDEDASYRRHPSTIGSRQSIMERGSSAKAFMTEGTGIGRRNLLPTVYKANAEKLNIVKNVRFEPFARRITVKSHHSMNEEEKSSIWWQASDFNDFKRGNVIITKSILEGGSEIWLTNDGAFVPNSQSSEEESQKWWHKYGHSRRGLEQVVSGEEARQRQQNVRMAMCAVLEEQERQKAAGKFSSEQLGRVAREYTAWAKDLALAAGASDADAVQSNFEETRKSREYFLLKHTLASQCAVAAHTPAFMVPVGLPTRILDANTSSNILYRKQMQHQLDTQQRYQQGKRISKTEPKAKVNHSQDKVIGSETSAKKSAIAEESLSTKAAGFGGDGGKPNMAVVMSTYDSSQ